MYQCDMPQHKKRYPAYDPFYYRTNERNVLDIAKLYSYGKTAGSLINGIAKKFRGKTSTKKRRSVTLGNDMLPGEFGRKKLYIKVTGNKIPYSLVAPGYARILQTFQGSHSQISGLQQTKTLFGLGTIDQIMTSTGVGYSNTQGPISYWGINPMEGSAAGTIFPARTNFQNDACFLESFDIKLLLTNWASASANMTIYVLICKVPTDNNPDADFWSDFADDANGQPIMTYPVAAIPATRGYPTGEWPYITPAKDFSKFWKIAAKRNFMLTNTASTEEFSIHCKVNKVIKKDNITSLIDANAGVRFMKGSVVVMVVSKGASVLKDTTAGASHIATLAPSDYGYVAYCRTNLRMLKGRNAMIDTTLGNMQTNTAALNTNLFSVEQTGAGQTAANFEDI